MAAQFSFTNVRSLRRLRVVNGTGDQLLACTCLPQQQDCRVAGRDRLKQFQNKFEPRAVYDDVLKFHLAAAFFFEIELLLGELVLELRDLVVCQSVFNGDGNLDLDARLRKSTSSVEKGSLRRA